jgi:hypothetical protein
VAVDHPDPDPVAVDHPDPDPSPGAHHVDGDPSPGAPTTARSV